MIGVVNLNINLTKNRKIKMSIRQERIKRREQGKCQSPCFQYFGKPKEKFMQMKNPNKFLQGK